MALVCGWLVQCQISSPLRLVRTSGRPVVALVVVAAWNTADSDAATAASSDGGEARTSATAATRCASKRVATHGDGRSTRPILTTVPTNVTAARLGSLLKVELRLGTETTGDVVTVLGKSASHPPLRVQTNQRRAKAPIVQIATRTPRKAPLFQGSIV